MPDLQLLGFIPATGPLDAAPSVPAIPPSTPASAFFNPTPKESALLGEIKRRESSNNYAAQNSKSTASGAYQFINKTWQEASDATGVPQYATAKEAPAWVQDVNALHLLRKYGANSSASWQASGPYNVAAITGGASRDMADAQPQAYEGSVTPDMYGPGPVTPEMYDQATDHIPQALLPSPVQPKPPAPLTFAGAGFQPAASGGGTEPSPLSKFGTDFWQHVGGPQMLDLAKTAISDPTAFDAKKRALIDAFGHILANEPARILPQAIESYTSLPNLGSSLYHAIGATPVIGGQAQEAMDKLGRGAYAEGFGHLLAIVAPFLAGPAAEAVGEVAGPALEATGTALKGGAGGAFKEATTMVPLKKFGIGINLPKPIVTGIAGGEAGGLVGIPHPVGAVVGAAAPVVGGFVRGVREALAGRAAAAAPEAAAEAVPEAAAEAAPAAAAAPPQAYGGYYTPEQPPAAPPETPAAPRWESPYAPKPPTAEAEQELALKKAIADRFGIKKSPDKWDDKEQALIQLWYDRATKGLPEEAPARVSAPPAETAAPAAPAAPQAVPEATPPPTAAPATPPAPEAPAASLTRQEIAAQHAIELEAMIRPDRLTEYAIRNEIPSERLAGYGDQDWQTMAQQTGTRPPTPQDIQTIVKNVQEYEKAQGITEPAELTPAELKAEFQKKLEYLRDLMARDRMRRTQELQER